MTPDVHGRHHFPTEGNKVYIREMYINAGGVVLTHKHKYEHYSILAHGTADVTVDKVKTRYVAPQVLPIKAGVEHTIKAVTDIGWFCVHGTDEDDPEKIDSVLVKEGA